MRIETERMIAIPFSISVMEMALKDKEELARVIEVAIPDEWPGPDFKEALPFLYEGRKQKKSNQEWDALIILKDQKVLIGDIGYKGGPDPAGTVDLGYSIVLAFRNRGLATEIVRHAVNWAREVKRIIAECMKITCPSMRVLEKIGFTRIGATADSIQWEWVWQKGQSSIF
jgi:[ribosomal protein S5]-alanine N-acetyltransferase